MKGSGVRFFCFARGGGQGWGGIFSFFFFAGVAMPLVWVKNGDKQFWK